MREGMSGREYRLHLPANKLQTLRYYVPSPVGRGKSLNSLTRSGAAEGREPAAVGAGYNTSVVTLGAGPCKFQDVHAVAWKGRNIEWELMLSVSHTTVG